MKRPKITGNQRRRLESLATEFITESFEFKQITVADVARFHSHLIGGTHALPSTAYLRFLQMRGVQAPTLYDLTDESIWDYYEFLLQSVSELAADSAVFSLSIFFKWLKKGKDERVVLPGVFFRDKVPRRFHIKVRLIEVRCKKLA